jgi:tetratricopeptide (TPR) repeat protein
MGRQDWFQNKSWDTATEARFNEKLCRARNKAFYLRVQAGHLVTADPRAALSLLDRYFALGDDLAKAQAFADQAKAYLALGAQEEALRSLENALQSEIEVPNVQTWSWSDYAVIVALRRLDHYYGRALQLLREHPAQSQVFPVTRFLWYAAFALISDAQGQRDDATEAAAKALSYAGVTDSGFVYHPNVGRVGARYDNLKHELRRLISN